MSVLSMTGIKSIAKLCAEDTEINAHNDAALRLAENFGNDRELIMIEQIKKQAEARGHGDNLQIMMRDYIVAAIIKRQEPEVAKLLHAAF